MDSRRRMSTCWTACHGTRARHEDFHDARNDRHAFETQHGRVRQEKGRIHGDLRFVAKKFHPKVMSLRLILRKGQMTSHFTKFAEEPL